MKVKKEWTPEDFLKNVGRPDEIDDLERVNCPRAGEFGHWNCGVCEKHNLPMFICNECIQEFHKQRIANQQD